MTKPLLCRTSRAIILMGFPDKRGVHYFPSQSDELPGLWFVVDKKIALVEQITKVLSKELDMDILPADFAINTDYCGEFSKDNVSYTLYIGICKKPNLSSDKTLPELIRAMPKTKIRSFYLKAWQALCGGM